MDGPPTPSTVHLRHLSRRVHNTSAERPIPVHRMGYTDRMGQRRILPVAILFPISMTQPPSSSLPATATTTHRLLAVVVTR